MILSKSYILRRLDVDRALLARLDDRLREFGKFSAVLLTVYFLEALLFNVALGPLGLNPVLAKTFSYLICAVISFAGNKMWTWRDHEPTGLAREYLMYLLVTLIGLSFLLILVGISHYVLGAVWPVMRTPWADNISANLVGPPLVSLFRFWAYRRFVYTGATAAEAASASMASAGHSSTAKHGSQP